MGVRRRASTDASRRFEDDRTLADRYEELRSGAVLAERELRDAQVQGRPLEEVRERNEALDHALGAALKSATAGERVAMGVKAYDDDIARRRATVRDEVRHWTAEVSKLRTLREIYRLEAISRTGTLRPTHVQVGTHAMAEPQHVTGAQPGQPDDAADRLDEPRVGVDLDTTIGDRSSHSRAEESESARSQRPGETRR